MSGETKAGLYFMHTGSWELIEYDNSMLDVDAQRYDTVGRAMVCFSRPNLIRCEYISDPKEEPSHDVYTERLMMVVQNAHETCTAPHKVLGLAHGEELHV
jgi:hypothetical protein